MEFNISTISDPVVQGHIVAVSIAMTQLFQVLIVERRNFWLPFLCVSFGVIATILIALVPPESLPVFAVIANLINGTGGIGLIHSVADRIGKKSTVLEPPVNMVE